MNKIQQKNEMIKRKFNKGDMLSLKQGYYYIWNIWATEKGFAPNQKPLLLKDNAPCKFVKNSPDGPSFKIVELLSGEQLEVLTALIK